MRWLLMKEREGVAPGATVPAVTDLAVPFSRGGPPPSPSPHSVRGGRRVEPPPRRGGAGGGRRPLPADAGRVRARGGGAGPARPGPARLAFGARGAAGGAAAPGRSGPPRRRGDDPHADRGHAAR